MDYATAAALGEPLAALAERIGGYLPALLGATVLLVVGWALARLLRTWTNRLIGRLDRSALSRPLHGGLRRIGVERPASEVVGATVFWIVLLLFVTAATETLGLPVVTTWLTGLSLYLPRILVAVLILLAGLLASHLAREATTTAAAAAGAAHPELLGGAAQVMILLVAGVTAVDQIGIDSRFLTLTVTIVIGSLIGGMALAFGLGARAAVSNIIASHYVRQTYRVGHTVRVGGVQGRIVEITTTAVILETADGRVLVPAKEFGEILSVLVTTGG